MSSRANGKALYRQFRKKKPLSHFKSDRILGSASREGIHVDMSTGVLRSLDAYRLSRLYVYLTLPNKKPGINIPSDH